MRPRVAATDEWTCVSTSISILRTSEVDTCFSTCRLSLGHTTVSHQSARQGSSGSSSPYTNAALGLQHTVMDPSGQSRSFHPSPLHELPCERA
jgi:hypothetical protein